MKKQNNNEENKCKITDDFLPSDGASCSESLVGCWCKRVWGDPFLPIGEALVGWVIGAIIGIVIVKVLL
jgi:hypothetical protein